MTEPVVSTPPEPIQTTANEPAPIEDGVTETEVENSVDKAVDVAGQTAKEKAHSILSEWWGHDEIEKILQTLERRGLALIHVK